MILKTGFALFLLSMATQSFSMKQLVVDGSEKKYSQEDVAGLLSLVIGKTFRSAKIDEKGPNEDLKMYMRRVICEAFGVGEAFGRRKAFEEVVKVAGLSTSVSFSTTAKDFVFRIQENEKTRVEGKLIPRIIYFKDENEALTKEIKILKSAVYNLYPEQEFEESEQEGEDNN